MTRPNPGTTPTAPSTAGGPKLQRVLGIPSLLFFGLAYMVPMTVFSTYGIVTDVTQGHLAGAYVITTIAMLFTALSYASIVRAVPTAGSAYGYARNAFGPGLGFITGWALMIDYMLLPMVNYMLIGLYVNAQFPAIPAWAVILVTIAAVTALNLLGISVVKNANALLVLFQIVFMVVFVALAVGRMDPAVPVGAPFWSEHASLGLLAAGASILALSFLGFDAVSAMAEEAKDPRRTVPVAVLLTVLVGGVVFVVITWISQRVWPDFASFASVDTASLELVGRVGGAFLEALFLAAYLVGASASALTSQASTARVLYAMGRDGVLPRSFFGRLGERFSTPRNAILAIAVVALLALVLPLDTVISVISFGALAAFSMVNLTVIKRFIIDERRRDARAIVQYLVLPLIGFALTIWLWTSLSGNALLIGGIWVAIGVIYLAVLSKGFRSMPKAIEVDLDA